jgi:signal transduction histidine kinase
MKLIPEAQLETIRFRHSYLGKNYTVEASGVDLYGYQELNYLVKLIWTLLAGAFLFILIAGIYNAYWSLKPFGRLISEIESFNLKTRKKKLDIYGTDELAQLSQSFNALLDQLIKAYEDQKAFVSQVSHELRTPVTALLGQIEVVLNKERTTEEYRKVIQSVYEDGLKIAVIINSLLELAESNLAPENIEFTDERIDELLFTIIDDFQKEIPESKISIGFARTPEEDTQLITKANKRLLAILFRNLIENALKFSEDKRIEITIEAGNPFIEITITDKGIGIAPEELDNIFKPMFRGMNIKKQAGHGLGLSIARQIAELHHATLAIESELNKGTKVIVNLLSVHQQTN